MYPSEQPDPLTQVHISREQERNPIHEHAEDQSDARGEFVGN